MVTIDLHTHSIISYDGGIREKEYEQILASGKLECIAITDHNEISFAQQLQNRLGDTIIVGEEVKTQEGEMIGLFLTGKVSPGLTAMETAKAIGAQGGLVYIPHPFETKRSSMQQETMSVLDGLIDIIEVFNARGRGRGKAQETEAYAEKKNLVMAAASDSHNQQGIGSAYSIISAMPTQKTLVGLLRNGSLRKQYAPLYSLLSPTINRMRKRLTL